MTHQLKAKIENGQAARKEAEDERGRLIELWSTDRTTISEQNESQWTDALRRLRLQPGCDKVARRHRASGPGTTVGEVVVIDWKRAKHRATFFKAPGSSNVDSSGQALQLFLEAAQRMGMRQQFLAKKIGSDDSPIIVADEEGMPYPPLERRLFEFLTAYFTADLPVATARQVDTIKGPQYFATLSCRDAPEGSREAERSPYDGLVSCHHGWALLPPAGGGAGTTTTTSSPPQAMIFVLWWEDEAGREAYRRQAAWKKRKAGVTMELAMESFVDDLEELGMVRLESQTFQLQQIGRW